MSYEEFTPQAGTHITNTGGIEVMLSEDGAGIFYRYTSGGDEPGEIKEAEVQYFDQDTDGEIFEETRPGFETDHKCRFYLDEMIRF